MVGGGAAVVGTLGRERERIGDQVIRGTASASGKRDYGEDGEEILGARRSCAGGKLRPHGWAMPRGLC